MKTITIVPPAAEDGLALGNGTKFLLNGQEVPHVVRCSVVFGIDEFVCAELKIAVGVIKDVKAHPLLDLETLQESAKHHGLVLLDAQTAARVQHLIDVARELDTPAEEAEVVAHDPIAAHKARVM